MLSITAAFLIPQGALFSLATNFAAPYFVKLNFANRFIGLCHANLNNNYSSCIAQAGASYRYTYVQYLYGTCILIHGILILIYTYIRYTYILQQCHRASTRVLDATPLILRMPNFVILIFANYSQNCEIREIYSPRKKAPYGKAVFCLGEKQGMLVNDECSSWYNRVGNF